MNNMQLYLSIGIPTLTVILAWVSSRADYNRLNDKIDKRTDSLDAKIDKIGDSLRAEMLAFRKEIAAEMIAFRREVHGDMVLLHERIVKVETRQNV